MHWHPTRLRPPQKGPAPGDTWRSLRERTRRTVSHSPPPFHALLPVPLGLHCRCPIPVQHRALAPTAPQPPPHPLPQTLSCHCLFWQPRHPLRFWSPVTSAASQLPPRSWTLLPGHWVPLRHQSSEKPPRWTEHGPAGPSGWVPRAPVPVGVPRLRRAPAQERSRTVPRSPGTGRWQQDAARIWERPAGVIRWVRGSAGRFPALSQLPPFQELLLPGCVGAERQPLRGWRGRTCPGELPDQAR